VQVSSKMSGVTLGIGNLSLSGMNSLLPEKLLNEKSSKVEYKAWFEKISNYLSCIGLELNALKFSASINGSSTRNSKDHGSVDQKSWLAYSIIMSRLDDQLVVQLSTVVKGDARVPF